MKAVSEYRHYPNRPATLTAELVEREYDRLRAEISGAEAAESAEAWIALLRKWDALKSYVQSEGARVHYLQAADLRDPEREAADRRMRETIAPVQAIGESAFAEAVVASRHREAFDRAYGKQFVRQLETQLKPLDPRLADLRVEESRLFAEYRKLVGTGEVEFRGERRTLVNLLSFRESPDGEERRESFLAHRGWFLAHRSEIARSFDELVRVRHAMAVRVGDANFIPLGYDRMRRTDYGVAESAAFRALVRDEIVPLQTRLHEEHARALGTPTLKPWDVDYDPTLTLPMGIAPIDEQLERAQRIFDRLSPELSHHFSMMREAGLIDLENRPGKAAGAFCTAFTDEGRSAILCNSTGSADDVSTLMHEMGHAFQSTESQRDDRPVSLVWPTSDAAEIHSMGMEYLSLPRIDEFFSPEDAAKFRRSRWVYGIELICYVALVDEFQHWIYGNPTSAADERDREWIRLAGIYQPSVDFGGIEHLAATRWYNQGHIFGMPFYYIDYALAETGAMQLSLLDASDPVRTMETYLELCRLGGRKSVLEIFSSAGLESPFSPASMKRLMAHALRAIGREAL